jgi:electron transfer flavoprotein alpha/beta subunit
VDEYLVTEAVLPKEVHKVKTTVLTVGADMHIDALSQTGLAIGIDEAVRVWEAGFGAVDKFCFMQRYWRRRSAKLARAAIRSG